MKRPRRSVLSLAALCALPLLLAVAWGEDAASETPPVELGAVPWLRDFDAAREQARADGKSLLVLFQEVPG